MEAGGAGYQKRGRLSRPREGRVLGGQWVTSLGKGEVPRTSHSKGKQRSRKWLAEKESLVELGRSGWGRRATDRNTWEKAQQQGPKLMLWTPERSRF